MSIRFVYQKLIMGNLANIVDPDEMPHDAAFQQGLHCLHIQRKKYNISFYKVITCDPSIYTMDHP